MVAVVEAPFRRTGDFEFCRHREKPTAAPAKLVILARGDDGVALELAALAEKLSFPARLVDLSDAATRSALVRGGQGDAQAEPRDALASLARCEPRRGHDGTGHARRW